EHLQTATRLPCPGASCVRRTLVEHEREVSIHALKRVDRRPRRLNIDARRTRRNETEIGDLHREVRCRRRDAGSVENGDREALPLERLHDRGELRELRRLELIDRRRVRLALLPP